MREIIVRYIDLPLSIKGYTATDSEDDYNVYINCNLSSFAQQLALEHELRHIDRDHFYRSTLVKQDEAEAELHPQADSDTDAETYADTDAEIYAQDDADAQAKADIFAQAYSDTETNAKAATKADTATKAKTNADNDANADFKTAAEAETETQTQTEQSSLCPDNLLCAKSRTPSPCTPLTDHTTPLTDHTTSAHSTTPANHITTAHSTPPTNYIITSHSTNSTNQSTAQNGDSINQSTAHPTVQSGNSSRTPSPLCAEIKAIRTACGLTAAQAAEICKMRVSLYIECEKGLCPHSEDTHRQILQALNRYSSAG